MSSIVTFGEIMARMAPAGVLRLSQVLPGSLEVTFAGAEANVAISLAILKSQVRFVTALPEETPLTDACLRDLRGFGVDVSAIPILPKGRFPIYFVETGANQRPGRVTYDRDFSTMSLATPDDFDWDAIFANAHWLHLTGITPALSRLAAESTLEAARQAKTRGLKISFDINFRSKLWRWNPNQSPEQQAKETLRQLVPLVDLLFANAEDCRLLGIDTGGLADDQAHPMARHTQLSRRILDSFPNLSVVSATWRQNISASHNNWGAMLFEVATDTAVFAPCRGGEFQPYKIRNIVDRVGGGDAYVAGLLFALHHHDYTTLQDSVEFATAASCLAHSITGDANFSTRAEIDALVNGAENGRVVR